MPRLSDDSFSLEVLRKPTEPKLRVSEGDNITIRVVGQEHDTGRVFFSSYDAPDEIAVVAGKKEVIPGLDKAVLQMSMGEIVHVTLAANLAFGERGFYAWGIPPHTDVSFEVEISKLSKVSPILPESDIPESVGSPASNAAQTEGVAVNVDGQTTPQP